MSEARMNEEARVSLTHREGIARSSPRHCGYCNAHNYRLARAGKQRGDDYRLFLALKLTSTFSLTSSPSEILTFSKIRHTYILKYMLFSLIIPVKGFLDTEQPRHFCKHCVQRGECPYSKTMNRQHRNDDVLLTKSMVGNRTHVQIACAISDLVAM